MDFSDPVTWRNESDTTGRIWLIGIGSYTAKNRFNIFGHNPYEMIGNPSAPDIYRWFHEQGYSDASGHNKCWNNEFHEADVSIWETPHQWHTWDPVDPIIEEEYNPRQRLAQLWALIFD